MTTGLTYATYVDQIATLAVVASNDANFQIILPQAITYAENRMCRDLDFLTTVATNTSYATASGTRQVNIPVSAFVTLQQINLISPAGTTNPELGTRVPLLSTTTDFLNMVYPSNTGAGLPQYFALLNQNAFVLGPWPNAAYTIELVGTVRPDSLSASNPSTFISLYLPDLFIMASMVYVSAYQRNFSGASANDPQMPVSYESQYMTLLKGATVEEARKKFQSSGWASMSPAPVASPSRG